MIIIISFLTNWCSGHKNRFCDELLSNKGEGTITLSSFLLSSHSLLSRETPSLERIIISNECLALGSVIEGVPNSLRWVSYEDIFLRFGFELIRMKFFSHKHRNSKL